jgi:hypothetical protein
MVLQIELPKSFQELWNRYSCASLHGAQRGQSQQAFRSTNVETQTSGATYLANQTR